MLRIRFQRVGRKNDPAFRVVVVEQRSRPQGAGIETLGSYHPKTKHTVLKNERILYWLSQGAKTSDTVHNLLVAHQVVVGKKKDVSAVSKKAPQEEAAASAPVSAEGGGDSASAPAEPASDRGSEEIPPVDTGEDAPAAPEKTPSEEPAAEEKSV